MSTTVDNRVIKMTFDNAQFERGIKSTMKTLSEFEKSMKLEGAAAGFDELSKATDKINLTGISDKAKAEANKVAEYSADASSSIGKIDDAAQNVDFSAVGNAARDAAVDVEQASADAASGIDSIDNSAQNVDFSPISNAATDAAIDTNNAIASIDTSPIVNEANEAAQGFSAFEAIALGALISVGDKIADFVTGGLASVGRKLKEFTIDPMVEGFKEYETQIGSIQTIMANTNMDFGSDEDIDTVNTALKELNDYADKTIYNFTEMTRNIGTFTAAGIELEPAKNAIQGIANMAALSGSNSQQASTAMYQLSQAMAAGTVKLQDWNSVVNAGMGGQVFQEALKTTARAHGIAVDEMIEANGSFRESLQEGWITSEVLTDTLNHMAISYKKVGDESYNAAYDQLRLEGYSHDTAVSILELAHKAELAATQVRTWSQLTDTVGEAIGSNWSQIWLNVLGDFKQATDTFTFLSESITGAVDGMLGGIVHASEIFKTSGAAEIIFGGYLRDAENEFELDDNGMLVRIEGVLDHIVQAISKPLQAIKDAFDLVFGIDDDTLGQTIVALALAFDDFAKSLIISDEAAEGLMYIFEGVFNVLKFVLQLVADGISIIFSLVDAIRIVTDPIVDIALLLGGQVAKVISWIFEKLSEVRSAIIEALYPLGGAIGTIKDAVNAFLDFIGLGDKINSFGDGLVGILELIWKFIDIPGKIVGLSKAIQDVVGFIANLIGWTSAGEEAAKQFEQTGEQVSALDIFIQRLMENPIVQFLKGIKDSLANVFTTIKDILSSENPFGALSENLPNVANGLALVKSGLLTVLDIIKTLATGVGIVLGGVIYAVYNLATAIGSLAGRFVEYFKNLEPVKETVEKLKTFKDTVVTVFLDLPNRIGAAKEELSSQFGGIEGIFGGVINKFNEIVNYFRTVSVEQFLTDIKNLGTTIINTFTGIFDYFKNVSPEQLMNDVWGGINSFRDKLIDGLSGIAEFIERYFPELNGKLSKGVESLRAFFRKHITPAMFTLESLASQSDSIPEFISKVFNLIKDSVVNKIDEIKAAIQNIDFGVFIDKLVDLKARIGNIASNLFDKLYDAFYKVRNFMRDFWTILGNFDAKDILSGFENTIQNITKGIEKLFPKTEPVLDRFSGRVGSTFNLLKQDGTDLRDVYKNLLKNMTVILSDLYKTVVDHIENLIEPAVQDIGNVLSRFIKIVINAFATMLDIFFDTIGSLTSGLEGLPGPFGQFFAFIRGKVDEAKNFVIDGIRSFADSVTLNGPILDNVAAFLKEKFHEVFNPDPTGGSGGPSIFDELYNYFSEKFNKFINMMNGFPEKFRELFDKFKGLFTKQNIEDAIEFIKGLVLIKNLLTGNKVLNSLNGFLKAGTNLARGYTNLINEQAKALKRKNIRSFTEKIKDLSIALMAIATALWIVSTIPDPDKAMGTLMGVAGVLMGMELIAGIIQKIFGAGGGKDLLMAAASLGMFALSMLISMHTITQLTQFDWAANTTGILEFIAFLTLLGVIAGMMTAIGGNGGQHLIAAAVAIGIMALSMNLLIGPLEEISRFATSLNGDDTKKAADAIAMLMLFVAEMGTALYFLKDAKPISSAIGLVIFAGAIMLIKDAVVELAKADLDGMTTAFQGLVILIGEFGVIAAKCKPSDLILTGGAMAIFAFSIGIMSQALSYLAKNNWESIAAAGASIVALVGSFGVFTRFTKEMDLVVTSEAILVFSAAVAVMAYSLYELAQVDSASVLIAAGAIDAVLLGLIGVVNFTKGADLIASALAVDAFAVAVVGISYALANLSDVDPVTVLSAAGAIDAVVLSLAGVTALTNGVDLFASALAIDAFAVAIIGISYALSEMASVNQGNLWSSVGAIGVLMLALSAVSLIGPELIIAAAAMDLFALALVGIAGALLMFEEGIRNMPSFEEFRDAGYNIVAGLGEGILSGIGHILEVLGNLGMTILNAILNFFGIHSPSLLMQEEVGQYIPEGIAQGILGGEGNLSDTLSQVFEGIMAKIGEFMANLPEFIQTTVLPMLAQAATDLWNWFTTDGIVMLQDLGITILNTLGDLLTQFWNWFTTDGLTMLSEAASAFLDWAVNVAIPAIGEFIQWIFVKLGELLAQFAAWMQSDGLPMLAQAASDFWNWVTTEGIPKLIEFIGMVMTKLGEFAMQFLQWLSTDGMHMLEQAVADFWNWVTTQAIPKLLEFIANIFKTLADLISQFGNWVQTDGLRAVGQALKDIMNKAGEIGGMILDWAAGIPGYIAQGINNIWHNILSVGEDIARGIADGIGDGVHFVTNAISSLGGQALDAVKNFFGIASPSKLMKNEVGRYIPEGVAEGISDYAYVAELAGEDMGQRTLNGVNSVLSNASYETPTIDASPIFDMSKYKSSAAKFKGLVSDTTVTADANVNGTYTGTVDAQANLDIWNQSIDAKLQAATDRLNGHMDESLGSKLSLIDDDLSKLLESSNYIGNKLNAILSALDLANGSMNSSNNYSLSTANQLASEMQTSRGDIVNAINNLITETINNGREIHYIYDKADYYLDGINEGTKSIVNEVLANRDIDRNIYLDSGALVGAIAPRMDEELGYRQKLSNRGII